MPKELEILINPNPILRKKSSAVDWESMNDQERVELNTLLKDMEMTMINKDGAGLAAPQIGKNIRIIVVHHDKKTFRLINPKITKFSLARVLEEEGCLSVLDKNGEIIYAPVERPRRVTCLYLDEKGRKKKIQADGMLARVLQHEIDHLDGILFIDRLKDFKSQPKNPQD